MVRLVKSDRSGIILEIDGSQIEFEGEAFLRGYGSPDYVIYSNSITNRTTGTQVAEVDVPLYLDKLHEFASEKGWTIEIE